MKLFVAAAALLALSTPHAQAADLSARPYTKAPVVAPVFSWTGFYVGANVGGGWGDRSVDYVPNDLAAQVSAGSDPFPFTIPGASFKASGVLGGVQVGYNYQSGANWLLGIEADVNGADITGRGQSSGQHGSGTITFNLPVEEQIKWFGTVRGRVGVLPTPNLLAYITGGFAYGQVDRRGSWVRTNGGGAAINSGGGFNSVCNDFQTCFSGSASNMATGWTAGGGLEYAFGPNWTIKGEYLFVSLDGKSITERALETLPGRSPASFNGNFSTTSFHVGRIGINYRFGGPVVAMY